jgi:Zn-dependent protease with chaperone function
VIGFKPAHPREIQQPGAVRFYTLSNLHVDGRKTTAACLGVLRPRVVIDRRLQSEPGFEAVCYHEGTHAYEHHSFVGVLLLVPGAVGFATGLALGLWALTLLLPASVVAWVLWQREKETRADAVALYGAGEAEFYCMLQRVGGQKARWGRWLYTPSVKTRTARARRRCAKHGWK